MSCQPQPEFYYLDGRAGSLNDFNGRWLIINFWAKWCSSCKKEVNQLNQLLRLHSKTLSIIGISYDPLHETELKIIVSQWDFHYPVLNTHPSPILPFSRPAYLPFLYIINPEKKMVAKIPGKASLEELNRYFLSLKRQYKND
jgi:thiol-disulfide isomerase/thioredoxin